MPFQFTHNLIHPVVVDLGGPGGLHPHDSGKGFGSKNHHLASDSLSDISIGLGLAITILGRQYKLKFNRNKASQTVERSIVDTSPPVNAATDSDKGEEPRLMVDVKGGPEIKWSEDGREYDYSVVVKFSIKGVRDTSHSPVESNYGRETPTHILRSAFQNEELARHTTPTQKDSQSAVRVQNDLFHSPVLENLAQERGERTKAIRNEDVPLVVDTIHDTTHTTSRPAEWTETKNNEIGSAHSINAFPWLKRKISTMCLNDWFLFLYGLLFVRNVVLHIIAVRKWRETYSQYQMRLCKGSEPRKGAMKGDASRVQVEGKQDLVDDSAEIEENPSAITRITAITSPSNVNERRESVANTAGPTLDDDNDTSTLYSDDFGSPKSVGPEEPMGNIFSEVDASSEEYEKNGGGYNTEEEDGYEIIDMDSNKGDEQKMYEGNLFVPKSAGRSDEPAFQTRQDVEATSDTDSAEQTLLGSESIKEIFHKAMPANKSEYSHDAHEETTGRLLLNPLDDTHPFQRDARAKEEEDEEAYEEASEVGEVDGSMGDYTDSEGVPNTPPALYNKIDDENILDYFNLSPMQGRPHDSTVQPNNSNSSDLSPSTSVDDSTLSRCDSQTGRWGTTGQAIPEGERNTDAVVSNSTSARPTALSAFDPAGCHALLSAPREVDYEESKGYTFEFRDYTPEELKIMGVDWHFDPDLCPNGEACCPVEIQENVARVFEELRDLPMYGGEVPMGVDRTEYGDTYVWLRYISSNPENSDGCETDDESEENGSQDDDNYSRTNDPAGLWGTTDEKPTRGDRSGEPEVHIDDICDEDDSSDEEYEGGEEYARSECGYSTEEDDCEKMDRETGRWGTTDQIISQGVRITDAATSNSASTHQTALSAFDPDKCRALLSAPREAARVYSNEAKGYIFELRHYTPEELKIMGVDWFFDPDLCFDGQATYWAPGIQENVARVFKELRDLPMYGGKVPVEVERREDGDAYVWIRVYGPDPEDLNIWHKMEDESEEDNGQDDDYFSRTNDLANRRETTDKNLMREGHSGGLDDICDEDDAGSKEYERSECGYSVEEDGSEEMDGETGRWGTTGQTTPQRVRITDTAISNSASTHQTALSAFDPAKCRALLSAPREAYYEKARGYTFEFRDYTPEELKIMGVDWHFDPDLCFDGQATYWAPGIQENVAAVFEELRDLPMYGGIVPVLVERREDGDAYVWPRYYRSNSENSDGCETDDGSEEDDDDFFSR